MSGADRPVVLRTRLPRALVFHGEHQVPALTTGRIPRARARSTRLRQVVAARQRSRHTTSCTSPTTCSACSTTSARSGPCSSATTGVRWSCGQAAHCFAPERVARCRRHERAVPPTAAPMAPIPGDAPDLRRHVLLHSLLPGAGESPTPTSAHDPATTMRPHARGGALARGRRSSTIGDGIHTGWPRLRRTAPRSRTRFPRG